MGRRWKTSVKRLDPVGTGERGAQPRGGGGSGAMSSDTGEPATCNGRCTSMATSMLETTTAELTTPTAVQAMAMGQAAGECGCSEGAGSWGPPTSWW